MSPRRDLMVLGVLVLAACAAGCSGAPDPGPVFDNEGGNPVTCMVHQSADPGLRYTDPAQRDTVAALNLLRYYTANASKPYCDGQGATDTDRRWAQEYLDLGGAREKVAPLIG